MQKEQILKDYIYPALDEVLAEKVSDTSIYMKPETVLFGEGSDLDSLGLVTFITIIEQTLQTKLKKNIVLANENVFSRSRSPFRTVSTLTGFIEELLVSPA